MNEAVLKSLFKLNPPVKLNSLNVETREFISTIPQDYFDFLKLSNGLYTGDRLVLIEAEDLKQRNKDYEVQEYLPGYLMIGDDSGGTAVLIKEDDQKIFEVGMGAMDNENLNLSAISLKELLIDFKGKTIDQR